MTTRAERTVQLIYDINKNTSIFEMSFIAGGFVRDLYFLKDPEKIKDVDIFIPFYKENIRNTIFTHILSSLRVYIPNYYLFTNGVYYYNNTMQVYDVISEDFLPIQLIQTKVHMNCTNYVDAYFDYNICKCWMNKFIMYISPDAIEDYKRDLLALNKLAIPLHQNKKKVNEHGYRLQKKFKIPVELMP